MSKLKEVDALWLIQRIDRWMDGHSCGRTSTIELLSSCQRVLAATADHVGAPLRDGAWVNAEIEHGHYPLIQIVLRQREATASANIIREELLRLIQSAASSASPATDREQ